MIFCEVRRGRAQVKTKRIIFKKMLFLRVTGVTPSAEIVRTLVFNALPCRDDACAPEAH